MLLTLKPSSRNGIVALDECAPRSAPHSSCPSFSASSSYKQSLPTISTGITSPEQSTTGFEPPAPPASPTPTPTPPARQLPPFPALSRLAFPSPGNNSTQGTQRAPPNSILPIVPAPEQNIPTMSQVTTPVGSLPPPPSQWHNSEESMRQWLRSKAEEDRRKQEEERTRQESLKLDQRKIEQTMLHEVLQAGVPPYIMPLVLASLGGGNFQWAQQYASQMASTSTQCPSQAQPPQQTPQQHTQPPQPPQPQEFSHYTAEPSTFTSNPSFPKHTRGRSMHTSTEIPSESRAIPPNPYAASPAQQLPTSPAPTSILHQAPPSPSQNMYKLNSSSNSASHPGALPRSDIVETHIHNTPASTRGSAATIPQPHRSQHQHHQQQRSSTSIKQDTSVFQQSPQPSTSISFHHWVPPTQSQPSTPAGKSPNSSPYPVHPPSHQRSEYQNSPKKRKSQSTQPQNPPPPSQLSEVTTSRQSPSRQYATGPGSGGGGAKRGGNSIRLQNEPTFQNDSSNSNNNINNTEPRVESRNPDPPKQNGQMDVNSLVTHSETNDTRRYSHEASISEFGQNRRDYVAKNDEQENRSGPVPAPAPITDNARWGGAKTNASTSFSPHTNGHQNYHEESRSATPASFHMNDNSVHRPRP